MNKIASAAAVLALLAVSSPALAASGEDGIGTYKISGNAGVFCRLGQISSASVGKGVNTTTDVAGGATSDANVKITNLADSADHSAAWTSVIGMTDTVCNTAYTVYAGSVNGGLNYTGTQTGSADFTRKLAYSIQLDFAGQASTARQASSVAGALNSFLNNGKAAAGTLTLTLSGAADASKYLLAGDYSDIVEVRIVANTGTPA